MRWGTPSRRARRPTARASAADERRRPCSTVTATSFGPLLRALHQRAASTSSAVESGPPEIARISEAARASGSNSAFASAAETGVASSAARTLLLALDALLHARGCARKFSQDLAERRAGRLLLAERGERLPETQQRIGRLGVGFVFGRDVEEGFRGVAEALALEQGFAEPIGGVAGEPIVGILAQEIAEAVFGQRVVLAQHIAIGEIEFVARRLRGGQRGDLAGRVRGARRRHRRQRIERTAGVAAPADLLAAGVGNGRGLARAVDRAEGLRRARRVRMLRRVERVATPGGRSGGNRRRRHRHALRTWRRGKPRRRAVLRHALHAADLSLQLLVAVLQLLDDAGELTDLIFK